MHGGTVTHLPGWTPFVGPKIQLGREWKTRLHQTADFTVQLAKVRFPSLLPSSLPLSIFAARVLRGGTRAQEGQSESVMSQELKGNGGLDEHSKMIAVTMNAGPSSLSIRSGSEPGPRAKANER